MKTRKMWVMLGVLMNLMLGAAAIADQPPSDVIPMKQAETTALKKYPGTIKESELEKEDGRWVYSFDIVGQDKKVHEVLIDAKSGEIVKHEVKSEAPAKIETD